MKVKLVKVTDDIGVYYVLNGSNLPENYVLSDKNCQAIECSYDLNELSRQEAEKIHIKSSHEDWDIWESLVREEAHSIKIGMVKMLELMDDKKFSEEDMIKFSEYCLNNNDCFSDLNDNLSKFQSLQQTEWDVTFNPEERDADGCLILKRI